MTYVVALHGSAGAGKSTLCRVMGEYLGTDGLIIQEDLDELLAMSSSNDDQVPWYRKRTVISANDVVTNAFMEYIGPVSMLTLALIVHFLFGTLWPIIILFIGGLIVGRFCHWFNSHLMSKVWMYNVFLLYHRQKKSDCRWIWRDRTCLDTFTYCLIGRSTSVPSDMSSIVLEQIRTTSVAIIMDVPDEIIYKHLKIRIHAPTTPFSMSVATRLLFVFPSYVRRVIAALKLLELWYLKMNVPVIKISQLRDKLDVDSATGEIQWNKRSINVLLETIEHAIEHRAPSPSTIDEMYMPWEIKKNSYLYHL